MNLEFSPVFLLETRPELRYTYRDIKFIADLHLHSKFSRATSRDMTFDTTAHWAKVKGVSSLATADFTHPEWFFRLKAPQKPDLDYLRSVAFAAEDVAWPCGSVRDGVAWP